MTAALIDRVFDCADRGRRFAIDLKLENNLICFVQPTLSLDAGVRCRFAIVGHFLLALVGDRGRLLQNWK